MSFITEKTPEDCLKSTLRYKDGSISMKVLINQFSGDVNAARNIVEAKQLRDPIHYKNEKKMSFELFPTK